MFQCFPCNQQILGFPANLSVCFPHWGQHDTLSQWKFAVASARCHTSPLPILLSICPLDAFSWNTTRSIPSAVTSQGLMMDSQGKDVIRNMRVWGWYPGKQLEYECSRNYQIIGSSCPIRNEPSPSETLKYSEHLSALRYEHHLRNEVSRVQAVVLLC